MGRYRKKPVVVDALQIIDYCGTSNWEGIADWCGGAVRYGRVEGVTTRYIEINTLEGVMVGRLGDWIIKGVKGEFYPCKPDIFDATYEACD